MIDLHTTIRLVQCRIRGNHALKSKRYMNDYVLVCERCRIFLDLYGVEYEDGDVAKAAIESLPCRSVANPSSFPETS